MSINPYRVVFFDLGDTLVAGGQWVAGAQDVIAKLRKSGVRLGVISNTGTLSRDELLLRLPLGFDFDLFDADLVVLSSEVGAEKPQSKIFRKAIKRAGVEAKECLFCTEEPLHVLAAQKAGIHALRLLKPPASDITDLVSILEELGGLP